MRGRTGAGARATNYRRLPHPVPPTDPVTRAGAVLHCTLDTDTARWPTDDPDDPDEGVRKELAKHPDLPPALRDELAADPDPPVTPRRTPTPCIGRDGRTRWRPADGWQLALRELDLPVESLHRPDPDPDPDRMVRRVTAAHPRLLAEGLARLLVDPSESVASAAAGNPDLPSAAMHRILALAGL